MTFKPTPITFSFELHRESDYGKCLRGAVVWARDRRGQQVLVQRRDIPPEYWQAFQASWCQDESAPIANSGGGHLGTPGLLGSGREEDYHGNAMQWIDYEWYWAYLDKQTAKPEWGEVCP